MKVPYLLLAVLLTGLVSCSKNKFTTTPQISIKSIGPNVVGRNDIFKVDLAFTDKQGDVHDSLFMFMHIINQNQKGLSTEFKSFGFNIPSYPDKTQGDFELTFARNLDYGYALLPDPATSQNDTVIFSFSVRDSGMHMSDTVAAGSPIVILSQ